MKLAQLKICSTNGLIFLHLFFTKTSAVQTAGLHDLSAVQRLETAVQCKAPIVSPGLFLLFKLNFCNTANLKEKDKSHLLTFCQNGFKRSLYIYQYI